MAASAHILLVALLACSSSCTSARGVSENIFGNTLVKCDRTKYFQQNPEQRDTKFPVTGYFRNNECTASSGDAGAHFVCVKMPNGTTPSGEVYSTFWTETGQARSPQDAVTWPKPGPWCICMWAFARMFSQHPDFIDMLQCDATNQWVIENYNLNNPHQAKALAAICSKCAVAKDGKKTHLQEKCVAVAKLHGSGDPRKVLVGQESCVNGEGSEQCAMV
eukprot:gnl/TRDRNA2_/TRDRNA2_188190_c0_seq1.p1 gnl/TRDRNA2_/TRDRNA2_188190_c0~~gnl/TRDRNA2_/TRDRNA2_188190_c0_seq1.p1  ORF type:complete len:236 (-),score=36.04 gnl/TRDRNA2_/TRDRNA2_188190_c0_seq1:236-892(-)